MRLIDFIRESVDLRRLALVGTVLIRHMFKKYFLSISKQSTGHELRSLWVTWGGSQRVSTVMAEMRPAQLLRSQAFSVSRNACKGAHGLRLAAWQKFLVTLFWQNTRNTSGVRSFGVPNWTPNGGTIVIADDSSTEIRIAVAILGWTISTKDVKRPAIGTLGLPITGPLQPQKPQKLVESRTRLRAIRYRHSSENRHSRRNPGETCFRKAHHSSDVAPLERADIQSRGCVGRAALIAVQTS